MSEQIYKQIEKFYEHKETKNDSKNIGEKYFYVSTQKAKDSADFFTYLKEEKKIIMSSNLQLMDLCFGSGNLTSHIALDTKLKMNHIYFNDIDTTVTNHELELKDKSTILSLDFLDFQQFEAYKNSINIVVFNPTISDGDIHRKISIKDSDKIIIREIKLDIDTDFKEYCKDLSLDVQEVLVLDSEKEIKVEIKGIKSELNKLPNSFNNYTIICKTTKMDDYESKASTVSKINQTISTILKDDGLIIFIGTDKQREVIFQNYNTVYRYLRDDNDVFIIKHSKAKILKCFEKDEDTFVINENCEIKKESMEVDEPFDDIFIDFDNFEEEQKTEDEVMKKEIVKKDKFSHEVKGNLKFQYKNILFKGVPGTGKSRAIDTIIEKELKIKDEKKNILRVNIHSASSNSDLMQGIGISSSDGVIKYSEKQGLILDIIKRATFNPNQPFALILEEIQENSLNELIGDLIYLIEDDKRAKNVKADNQEYSYKDLVNKLIEEDSRISYIEIPYLVNDSTDYKKMIMPNNLFIFCTSNYRDDKKVIEDNLLRRFEVIEIYPNSKVANEYAREFFTTLNDSIIEIMGKNHEIHPDRFMIGHSIWKDVTDEKTFYKAFSKLVTEFKDIREVEFENFKNIIKVCKIPDNVDIKIETIKSYFDLIKYIQEKINYDFIS